MAARAALLGHLAHWAYKKRPVKRSARDGRGNTIEEEEEEEERRERKATTGEWSRKTMAVRTLCRPSSASSELLFYRFLNVVLGKVPTQKVVMKRKIVIS